MKVELVELLHERSICHPNRIVGVTLGAGSLTLTIDGCGWWEPTGSSGTLVLEFANINEGLLDIQLMLDRNWDEALDFFQARPLHGEEWAMLGTIHSTYCRQAIPDPMSIYAIVHDFLIERHAPLAPMDYLNRGETIASFCTMASNTDFLLSRAPTALHDRIEAALLQRGVQLTILRRSAGTSSQVFVILGNGSFICDEATASWD